jgi:hypothetical protein
LKKLQKFLETKASYFKAGSFSFLRKSAAESELDSQFKSASLGTFSIGVCQELDVSL